jgi:hypothetical protein
MTVTVTTPKTTADPTHKKLVARIGERFPSVWGVNIFFFSDYHSRLTFELNDVDPEEVRSFFAQEGLIPTIE